VQIVIAYFIAALLFVGLDMVWLGAVARDIYRVEMAELMTPNVRLLPALAFYALYIFGVMFFAVLPALRGGSWMSALGTGCILGLVAYGTYDLTNLAVVRNWPVRLTFIDLAWGTILTGLVAGGTTFIVLSLSGQKP